MSFVCHLPWPDQQLGEYLSSTERITLHFLMAYETLPSPPHPSSRPGLTNR